MTSAHPVVLQPHKTLTENYLFHQRGGWRVLSQYPGSDWISKRVRTAFMAGVDAVAGEQAAAVVLQTGLNKLHTVIPANAVPDLERFVRRTIEQDCYRWSYQVGREYLGFDGDFLIDANVVVRIHLPDEIAEATRTAEDDIYAHKFGDASARRIESPFDHYSASLYEYHRRLSSLSWIHGGHRDCWYGNSLDGINLWLAIEGVTEDSGMIFYPETTHTAAVYDRNTMYTGEGWRAPKPVRVFADNGQLIAFNGNMVHSSICNTSEATRLAITCRLNAEAPTFIKEAYWQITRWLNSADVERGVFESVNFVGAPVVACGDTGVDTPVGMRKPDLVVDAEVKEEGVRVLPSEALPEGSKCLVAFRDGRIVVGRGRKGPFAIGALCPHRLVSLADGYLDDDDLVWCPGHGLRFDVHSGRSCAARYHIPAYAAIDDRGWVVVSRAPDRPGAGS